MQQYGPTSTILKETIGERNASRHGPVAHGQEINNQIVLYQAIYFTTKKSAKIYIYIIYTYIYIYMYYFYICVLVKNIATILI